MLGVRAMSNGICTWRKSCVWTSVRGHGVVSRMNNDTSDLVVQLCTRIGMIMEDVSSLALTVAGMDIRERKRALTELDQEIERAIVLIAAAKALDD